MANLIGKTLGTYRIIEQIGLGGMATVYKAYQPSMERYVALKVLSTHLSQTPTFVTRFQQEARVIAKLEHLHILPVYDHGEEEGYLYLVMRFIEAGTLKDRLAQGGLSLAETRRVVNQVGSALAYAHQLGVIHRDVKPSNILIDAQGDCYLTDFGIAKMVESSLNLTGSNMIGTPQYMAPEQGETVTVDERADVYAMGVVIYEMVTGRLPFDAETPFAVVMKHLTEPLPLPRSLRPNLPEEVEQVILKALAKDPAGRYQTMQNLVTAFDQAVQAASAEVRAAPGPGPVVYTDKGPEPVSTATLAPGSPWRRWLAAQPPWLLGAALLGFIVLLAAGLILSQMTTRVEISGGQVQVIFPTATVMPTILPLPTATEAAEVIPPTITAPPTREKFTATPLPTLTPSPTPTPSSTPTLLPTSPPSLAEQTRTYLVTDRTWKFSPNPAAGWSEPTYDDSGWAVPDSKLCQNLWGMNAACLWEKPYRYAPNHALYFRQMFNLAGVPTRARVVTLVDDDVELYVNGQLAQQDNTEGISWWETDVTGLLQPGPNVLVLRGVDTGEGTAYVQAVLGLCEQAEDKYEPIVGIMNHWEDWFDGQIYLEAVDAPCDSGVVEVAYRIEGGEWQTVERHQPFDLPPGEYDVEARAIDGAGRQGFDQWHFQIGQPPATPIP